VREQSPVVIGFAGNSRLVPGCGDASTKDTVTAYDDQHRNVKRPGRPAGTSRHARNASWRVRENLFARKRGSTRRRSVPSPKDGGGSTPLLVHHYFRHQGPSCSRKAIHIPIDPMAVIGPLTGKCLSSGSDYVLPSILLPLWDSEMGKGFIATLRSILAGRRGSSLIRSFSAGK